MSNGAQALGVQTVAYEYAGVAYTLSPHDLEDYAKYELSLEEAGWAALKRARHMGWLADYEYKEMVREWLSVLATHQLAFGSPDFVKSTNSIPGMMKLLELSLAHRHEQFRRNTLGELPPESEKRLRDMAYKDHANVVEALTKLDAS